MPRYAFFIKDKDVRATDIINEHSELLGSGYEKVDFEAEAENNSAALKLLQEHLSQNTEANRKFTGDVTFSSFIESLLR